MENLVDKALQDERCWTVYVHINKFNGKKYVGITSNKPERRWGSNGCNYSDGVFRYAIKKYGWDGFEHEIIAENLTEKESKQFEITLIRELDTHVKNGNGYNCTDGGDGTKGYIPNDETKRKISIANKGERNSMYGKTHTEETKRKMVENRTQLYGEEHPRSKEVICDGMVFCSIGECAKYYEVNDGTMRGWLYGDAMPDNFIQMGLNFTENPIIPKPYKSRKGLCGKPVICDGNIFKSITQMANRYSINPSTARSWVNGERKIPKEWEELGLMYYEDYLEIIKEREVI